MGTVCIISFSFEEVHWRKVWARTSTKTTSNRGSTQTWRHQAAALPRALAATVCRIHRGRVSVALASLHTTRSPGCPWVRRSAPTSQRTPEWLRTRDPTTVAWWAVQTTWGAVTGLAAARRALGARRCWRCQPGGPWATPAASSSNSQRRGRYRRQRRWRQCPGRRRAWRRRSRRSHCTLAACTTSPSWCTPARWLAISTRTGAPTPTDRATSSAFPSASAAPWLTLRTPPTWDPP